MTEGLRGNLAPAVPPLILTEERFRYAGLEMSGGLDTKSCLVSTGGEERRGEEWLQVTQQAAGQAGPKKQADFASVLMVTADW